jgi:hypothetical protein
MPQFERVSIGLKNFRARPHSWAREDGKKKKKKYSRRAGNALENFSRNKKMKRVERTKQHWSKQIKFPLL